MATSRLQNTISSYFKKYICLSILLIFNYSWADNIEQIIKNSKYVLGSNQSYYKPNSPQGNIVNIAYDSTKIDKVFFNAISNSYLFERLASKPKGTRYIATQFWLDPLNGHGNGDAMYIGVNPPNLNYQGQVHFSYFGDSTGAVILNTNCAFGADGGSGITCATEFKAKEGYKYELTAKIEETTTNTTTLSGHVFELDPSNNIINSTEIGRFKILKGAMGITYPTSWIEGSSDSCDELVYTRIEYSPLWFNENRDNIAKFSTIESNKCGVYVNRINDNSTTIFYGNKKSVFIQNVNNGKVADIYAGNISNGTKLTQYTKKDFNSFNQLFDINYKGISYNGWPIVTIAVANNTDYAVGAGTGHSLLIQKKSDSNYQKWAIDEAKNSKYRIMNIGDSYLMMDVRDASDCNSDGLDLILTYGNVECGGGHISDYMPLWSFIDFQS